MKNKRINFSNGDYLLFSEGSIHYYRKHLQTPKTFGYKVTTLKEGTQLRHGPLRLAIIAAQVKIGEEAANMLHPQTMVPVISENPNFEVIDRGACPQTGQELVRVVARRNVSFDHPIHPENEERRYRVSEGETSGWMPEECVMNKSVWVDNSSSLSGDAQNTLVTNNSQVIGSSIAMSWIRRSHVSHSTVLLCVVQTADVKDSDISDCGVRRCTVVELNAQNTSMNGCQLAVAHISKSTLADSSLTNCVIISSSTNKLTGTSAHVIECEVNHVTLNNSTFNGYALEEGSATECSLTDKDGGHLSQFLLIHNHDRSKGDFHLNIASIASEVVNV